MRFARGDFELAERRRLDRYVPLIQNLKSKIGVIMSQAKKARGRRAANRATRGMLKIYSVPALLIERQFRGGFDVPGSLYQLVYAPQRAEVVEGKLQLVGRLTLLGPQGQARSRNQVRATLEGTQGGVGAAPIRRQLLAAGAQTGTVSTAEEKQQLASENEKKLDEPAKASVHALPVTESAGPESFCGVMYFRLEPLDNRALGVTADLKRVQLNARLAPTDDTAHRLQDLYTAVVEALYGEQVNERLAAAAMGEINKLLSAG
jgi:hypothetical protein